MEGKTPAKRIYFTKPYMRIDGELTPYATVRRWAINGSQADNGKQVFLKKWRRGGRSYTTEQAVAEFFSEQNGGEEAP